jgi:hypothetical protein
MNTEAKQKEYRENTGKEFPKIPHISPKKVHKSTHYKKGLYRLFKAKGKGREKRFQSGYIFGSKIVKKKWGCEGCRKVVAKLFQSESLIYLKKLQLFIPQAI